MFRKFLIFVMFATAAGYCFADGNNLDNCDNAVYATENALDCNQYQYKGPTWPVAGSDADVQISGSAGLMGGAGDNIRIVSKIGADFVVENNINAGGDSWSGGANMLHVQPAPSGFNIYENQAEMPLFHAEMPEDDGAAVLAASRSTRKVGVSATRLEIYSENDENNSASVNILEVDEVSEIDLPNGVSDQVRSWVVASGQTLREVLQDWCDKEGWDLVWGTSREYPIQASAVFKGRFVDVSSALVRNFGRATPVPYAKFYKGNRVLVMTTAEDGI